MHTKARLNIEKHAVLCKVGKTRLIDFYIPSKRKDKDNPTKPKGWEIKPNSGISEKGGIYSFWLKDAKLIKAINKKEIELHGKREEGKAIRVNAVIDKDWISKATHNNALCLYVGKTSNIRERMSDHILSQTTKYITERTPVNNRKQNSAAQLRIGMERVFKDEPSILGKILKYVYFSYIELDGPANAVNRFYLEDKYVGQYFPIFNIDIER